MRSRRSLSVLAVAPVALLGLLAPLNVGASARASSAPASSARPLRRTPARTSAARPEVNVEGRFYVPLVGDFDGDGQSDIFWYAPGEAPDSVWFGGADRQFTATPEHVLEPELRPVVGDFNNDGRSDILWSRPFQPGAPLWTGNANRTFTSQDVANPNGNFVPVGGDFNGDGHADILWYALGTASDFEWLGDGHVHFTSRTLAINGDYDVAAGDFNGDGRTDVFFTSLLPTPNYLDLARPDGTFSGHAFNTPMPRAHPFAVDANRDGRDDIFVYRPGPESDWLWYSSTSATPLSRRFTSIDGIAYRPVVGDFDGDGHDDVFWYGLGAESDSMWFAVGHDIPPARGSKPHEQWEVSLGARTLMAATVDATGAYVVLDDHHLYAFNRSTGLPKWQQAITCNEPALHRQLEILKLTCSGAPYGTYVYDAATGAARYHFDWSACTGDNSYYDARSSGAHLTVIAARTGAVVWTTPFTSETSCAISHQRLMVADPNGHAGVVEYDIATHQQVFNYTQAEVYRFGPAGYLAVCDAHDHLEGLDPAGAAIWTTPYGCDPSEAPLDFGTSTADHPADLDIVTGKLLGVAEFDPSAGGGGGYPSANRAVFHWSFNAPLPGQCITPRASVSFESPFGVSPLLPAAIQARFDFSNRAIAVLRPNSGGCHVAHLLAYDQNGTFRWDLIGALDPHAPVGNDMATNGGNESSALLGVNPVDRDLELIDLPTP